MCSHVLWHIHHDADTQTLQHLKELSPLHGFAATLHLAQEVSLTPTLPAASSWRIFCALRLARTTLPMVDALVMGMFMANPHNCKDFEPNEEP